MSTTQTTTATIFISPSTPIVGGIVTLLAKITPSDSGVVSGTVMFSSSYGSGTTYGSVPIVNNEARMTIDTSYGNYTSATFTATYSGDEVYATSAATSGTITFTAYLAANGIFVANSSNSGAFDYTQQMNYIASSLKTIAVNSSEIRNYVGDISKSISTIADLASGNGVHTSGAYDWITAASLYQYYVQQGAASNTSGYVNAAAQAAANTAFMQYANSSNANNVLSLKVF